MTRLLAELEAVAADGADRGDRERASVLAAGLGLVAGRPAAGLPPGTVEDAVLLAAGAIPARTQGLVVEVAGPLPALPVPGPAAIALALVQLAVNAEQHDGAERVTLRVGGGPTFVVEWPATEQLGSTAS